MTSSQEIALQIIVIATIATVIFIFVVLVGTYVLMAATLMRFFRKVGIEPWIAWVPFYSTWKWLEVGGLKGSYALLSLIPYGSIATSVLLYIGMHRTGIAFRRDAGFLVLGIFLPFVWAYILGDEREVYEPQRIVAAGYPPPLAGYGSVAPTPGY